MQGRRQFVIMPAKFNDKAVEIIMLWFKNLMVYRLSREISLRAEEMEKQLASMAFTPCGSQDMAKMAGYLRWIAQRCVNARCQWSNCYLCAQRRKNPPVPGD